MTAIEFRAPWGRTVRIRTTAFLVVIAVIVLFVTLTPPQLPWPFALAPFILLPLALAGAFAESVRGYTLTEDAITVHRGFGKTRLPLAGLRSVAGNADAMRGSVALWGSPGIFAISGRFWSRTLGWHRAFVTDRSRAVVLRYVDRTIVISPHDPQQFIMRAGTFIKIAGFPR